MTKDDLVSKDTALKMAIEALEDVEKNCTYWEADMTYEEFTKRIQACKEALEQEERTQRTMHCGTADAFIAMDDDHKRRWFVQSLRESKRRKELEDILEQPLTRDWKETIDERIAKDDKFKEALEQPSVAELNDEYLRDTHVEGLSSAQEPVEMPSKLSVLNKYGTESEESIKAQQTYAKGWNDYADEVSQLGSLYTYPTPSWQGLSDDEKLAIIRKWKDAHTMREQELIGLGDAFEQALKEKNT